MLQSQVMVTGCVCSPWSIGGRGDNQSSTSVKRLDCAYLSSRSRRILIEGRPRRYIRLSWIAFRLLAIELAKFSLSSMRPSAPGAEVGAQANDHSLELRRRLDSSNNDVSRALRVNRRMNPLREKQVARPVETGTERIIKEYRSKAVMSILFKLSDQQIFYIAPQDENLQTFQI
jgi:hypothetical protein